MKTTLFISLHKKAISLLEKIEICDMKIQDAKEYISGKKHLPEFSITVPYYEKTLNTSREVKRKLANSYAETMQKMVKDIPIIKELTSNAIAIGDLYVGKNGMVGTAENFYKDKP